MQSKRPIHAVPPPALRHRRAATSSPVPIGVDRKSGIHLQEYWQQGKAHYAVSCANREIHSFELRTREQSQHLVGGPWMLKQGTVTCFPLPPLPTDGLIALFINGGDFAGNLKVPVPPAPPFDSGNTAIYTVDGLNGTGPKVPQMWCAQDLLRYPPESEAELRLRLPGDMGTVSLIRGRGGLSEMDIRVLDARSETLGITAGPEAVRLSTVMAPQPAATHLAILRVKFPALSSGQILARLNGRVDGLAGGTFPFLRGIIIAQAA